jgi:hemoglobin/transferrin/lactoferrin receptor protein
MCTISFHDTAKNSLTVFARAITAIFSLCHPVPGSAQSTEGASRGGTMQLTAELPEVAVTATRTASSTADAPATVTVVTASAIESRMQQDIRDLVRYEPNVSVSNSPTRFGLSGFNIRGIDGNRILMQVDGVKLPDSFSIGSFSSATRDSIDLDLLKSVEILRGPGSSLYGSDALGGVVSFFTKDPADLLRETAGEYYASVKLGYASADQSRSATATLARGRGAPVQALLSVTRRESSETRTSGGNDVRGPARSAPNPLDSDTINGLVKIVWDTGGPLLRLTLEGRDATNVTNLLTLNPLAPKTVSLTGDDRAKRMRIMFDAEWSRLGFADSVRANVFRQESKVRQRTLERRDLTNAACSGMSSGTSTCTRDVEFAFDQEIAGLGIQGETRMGNSAIKQRITYGVDSSNTEISQLRNGLQTITPAGGATAVTNRVGADVFPVRDFPLSDVRQTGIYLQDEISLAKELLMVVPGIRYDQFKLKPRADNIFTLGNPGIQPQSLSSNALSPRIGVIWKVLPALSLYAQYAEGFRAPPYNDVNLGFTNLAFGYTAIPNANLKSESSRGAEFGLRGSVSNASYSLTYFDNRYKDFIASLTALNCPGDPRCSPLVPVTFQSINLDRVRINGVEARADVSIDNAIRLFLSAGTARGRNENTGANLNSVDPLKAALGAKYDSPGKAAGAEVIATYFAKKTGADGNGQFVPAAAAVLDANAYFVLGKNAKLNLAAFNLTNKKYWLWSDVRGLQANNAALDRFTQAERNFLAAIKVSF